MAHKAALPDDRTSFDLGNLHFESLANGGVFQLGKAGGDTFQELPSAMDKHTSYSPCRTAASRRLRARSVLSVLLIPTPGNRTVHLPERESCHTRP